MRKVLDYNVTDHGVVSPQYFQGHGIVYTDWEDTATGCGDSYNEAFEDALDNLAACDWDVEGIVNEDADNPDTSKTVLEWLEIDQEDKEAIEELDCYYYVSIDVK